MFSALVSVLAVLFGFSLLIVWHELGHLLAALSIGLEVEVFSIGFGQRLWGFRFRGIDFRISAIPFGGYVRFADEGGGGIPREFFNRPLWQRIWVVLAGPLFSFILGPMLIALALAVSGNVAVMTTRIWRSYVPEFMDRDSVLTLNGEFLKSGERFLNLVSEEGKKRIRLIREGKVLNLTVGRAVPVDSLVMRIPPIVGEVKRGYPAYDAGVKVGDTIVAVDTVEVGTWQDLVNYVQDKGDGDTVLLTVRRKGKVLTLKVGVKEEGGVGRIGIVVAYRTYPMTPLEILKETGRLTVKFSVLLADAVKRMVRRQVKVEEAIGGPITIGAAMATTAQEGIDRYLLLLAVITLQLAVINLLPIPGLDGGHILFFLVDEAYYRVKKRRIPERAHLWIVAIGVGILMLLAALILGLDILKLLTGRLLPR